MSKTPYEIRLDLLKLAKETAYEAIHAKREAQMAKYHSSRETYPGEVGPRDPLAFPSLPEFPSLEEILKDAEKLKGFVDAAG